MAWAIFSDEHMRAIKEITESDSDRIIAVVGGAILDNTLHRTLRERFRDDKDITKKLLKVNGALGNTVPKIDILYQLYAFEKPVRNAMYGISIIRNFLAHNLDAALNSTNKEMADAFKLLTLHENIKCYPHHLYNEDSEHEIEPVTNNRERFLVNLKLCLIALMRDRVSHVTWTNSPLPEAELRKQMDDKQKAEASTKKGPKKP